MKALTKAMMAALTIGSQILHFTRAAILVSLVALAPFLPLYADADTHSSDINSIFKFVNDGKASLEKRVAAFALLQKLDVKIPSKRSDELSGFLFEILTGDFKDDVKEKVFEVASNIPLTVSEKFLSKFKEALRNPKLSRKSIEMIFKVLYVNFEYTLDFKREIFNYLYDNRKKLAKHPEYVYGMVEFLYSHSSYEFPDSYEEKLRGNPDKIDWRNLEFQIDEKTPDKFYDLGFDVMLKYSEIMTASDGVISFFVKNNKDLCVSNWTSCVVDLFYKNHSINRALPVADALSAFIKNNPNQKDVIEDILDIINQSFFLKAISKKHFNTFCDLMPLLNSKPTSLSRDAEGIVKFFLRQGDGLDFDAIERIKRDNHLIEKYMFDALKKREAEDRQDDEVYSKLRIWAICYPDFNLPEYYKSILDGILKGGECESEIWPMSIILIQKNPKYGAVVKAFVEEILDNPDKYQNVLDVALGDGIDLHWINDPDIRTRCLNLLEKRSSSFEVDLNKIFVFWNISDDKIPIAEKLLDFHAMLANQKDVKGDSEKMKALNAVLNDTLKKMFLCERHSSPNDWRRYIAKLKASKK